MYHGSDINLRCLVAAIIWLGIKTDSGDIKTLKMFFFKKRKEMDHRRKYMVCSQILFDKPVSLVFNNPVDQLF